MSTTTTNPTRETARIDTGKPADVGPADSADRAKDFRGDDPGTAAQPTICQVTPTKCQARTRLYRNGVLELEGFPVVDISDYVSDPAATVWLDLRDPDLEDLKVLSEEFGLHPLAVEDAVNDHQRPKLDRYRTHLFLNTYAVTLDTGSGELTTSEVSAFVLERGLITVRKDDAFDIAGVVERWDDSPDLAKYGVGFLLHGLLDHVVDGHFTAVQSLDDEIEDLQDALFSDKFQGKIVQRRSFELRKSLVRLRRVVLPMREVVNSLLRRDLHVVEEAMQPYYQDVYDHVLRATEWTESLRDLVTTILETNLTIQGNRLNEIMKRLTAWAAIIAVPTAVTGWFGQNVPYPGFQHQAGLYLSAGLIITIAAALIIGFRRKGWL